MSSEYERTPVPENALKGPGKFWGMYAGEHTAGTEFMIGPLFLLAGVSLSDLFIGLFIGNLLAVLSWRFLCAPVATEARMTLYYQLEKIAGGDLVKIYNVANGILFCFLAGAMITVSATAVGIPFDMPMPSINDMMPGSVSFVIIVLAVGAVIALVAASGYETVSKFANIASPWMVLVFLACGVVSLAQMGVGSYSDLESVWAEAVTFVQAESEASVFTLSHIIFFSWFCNAAMHVGMADLSVFRYAKKPSSGWATAAGMYVGHYMAWIAAAFMLAAQIKFHQDSNPVPGPMAFNSVGLIGCVCVVVAGWTTANPTIYRAGLAFQAIMPGSSRFVATLIAGSIATIAAVFPAFAWKLLTFVGLYGTILAPMGAVIYCDWRFAKSFGITQFPAEKHNISFNPAVLLAWLVPVGIAVYCILGEGMFAAYFPLPCWIATGGLYLILSKTLNKSATV